MPAVLGALLGKWLDEKYNTEPRYLIIFLVLAFLSSAVVIVRKAKKYSSEYDAIIKKDV